MAIRSPEHRLTKGVRGWQKKIHGKTVWIASLKSAPTGAEADAIYAARVDAGEIKLAEQKRFSFEPGDLTVRQLCDAFLERKHKAIRAPNAAPGTGIENRTVEELQLSLQDFCDSIGKEVRFEDLGPSHFVRFIEDLRKRFGLHRLKKWITNIRSMFKWASQYTQGLPNYGDGFKLPSRSDFRRARKASREKYGVKMYQPNEICEQLKGKPIILRRKRRGKIESLHIHRGPSPALKAMILLGVNCGFGNRDCADLPLHMAQAVIDGGEWLEYARGKTGADRMAWIWPETRAALAEYANHRQKPTGAGAHSNDRFFLTQTGRPWVDGKKDQIGMRHAALLDALGHRRRGFRSYRRTFRTIAAETGQELATDLVMGHADRGDDMAMVYTVEISREIVKSVCQHVRTRLLAWNAEPELFPGSRLT